MILDRVKARQFCVNAFFNSKLEQTNRSQVLANQDQMKYLTVSYVFRHTYVCIHVCFVRISLQNVIARLKTMLLFKTPEGV